MKSQANPWSTKRQEVETDPAFYHPMASDPRRRPGSLKFDELAGDLGRWFSRSSPVASKRFGVSALGIGCGSILSIVLVQGSLHQGVVAGRVLADGSKLTIDAIHTVPLTRDNRRTGYLPIFVHCEASGFQEKRGDDPAHIAITMGRLDPLNRRTLRPEGSGSLTESAIFEIPTYEQEAYFTVGIATGNFQPVPGRPIVSSTITDHKNPVAYSVKLRSPLSGNELRLVARGEKGEAYYSNSIFQGLEGSDGVNRTFHFNCLGEHLKSGLELQAREVKSAQFKSVPVPTKPDSYFSE